MAKVLGLTVLYTALAPEAQLAAKRLALAKHVLADADYAAVAGAIINEVKNAVITDLKTELAALGKQQEQLAAEARLELLAVEGVSPP